MKFFVWLLGSINDNFGRTEPVREFLFELRSIQVNRQRFTYFQQKRHFEDYDYNIHNFFFSLLIIFSKVLIFWGSLKNLWSKILYFLPNEWAYWRTMRWYPPHTRIHCPRTAICIFFWIQLFMWMKFAKFYEWLNLLYQ